MRSNPRLVIVVVIAVAMAFLCTDCFAGSAINIPVGSRTYEELELMEVKGLIESGMLSTKPFSRNEAARLSTEARARLNRDTRKGEFRGTSALSLIRSLERELKEDMEFKGDASFVKPLDRLTVRYLYSDRTPYFVNTNNNGDSYSQGSNIRASTTLNGMLLDTLSFSFTPEYRSDDYGSRGELVTGYGALDLRGLVLEVGRDSMWWGPGYHGALLVTNNARPFDMVKLTTLNPVPLPWIFRRLGLLKPTVFLTHMEEDRTIPRANLLGMRLDFKPARSFGFALNRVFMFGGKNRPALDFEDWLKVFTAQDSAEHTSSPINGNQLASIDAYYVYVNRSHPFLPFSGLKLYTEWGAEDSSGETKTPSNRANMYGVLVDEPFWLTGTDLRVEWANTARRSLATLEWYTHYRYSSGYTYEGNFIGHHMGGDSRDLFLRLSHRRSQSLQMSVEGDMETNGVHMGDQKVVRKYLAFELKWSPIDPLEVTTGVAIEEHSSRTASLDSSNYHAWLGAGISF